MYRDHRRGSGGPPGGSTCPGGPYGLCVERDQPLSGLGASPLGPMRLGFGGTLKGGAPLALGGKATPLGRRPLLRLDLRGPAPLSLAPIYMWGLGGQPHPSSGAALPLSQVLLFSRGAWRSPAGLPRSSFTTMPSCCCWMESSPTSPSPLAGSRRGRRNRATRVLNAEAPWFGA